MNKKQLIILGVVVVIFITALVGLGYFALLSVSKLVTSNRIFTSPGALRAGTPAITPPTSLHTTSTTLTEAKLRPEKLAYFDHLIVQGYQKAGIHNPAWDKKALRLLDTYSHVLVEAVPPQALHAPARELMALKCKDPYVAYVIGVSLMMQNRNQEAEPFVRQAVAGFDSDHHARAFTWVTPLRLSNLQHQLKKLTPEEEKHLNDLAVQWLSQACAEKNSAPYGARFLYDRLAYEYGSFLSKCGPALCQALLNQPNCDPWLREMIIGNVEVSLAWQSRGNDWGANVTKKGWEGFYAHLKKARQHLTKAWQLHTDLPEAPAAMIIVAMGEVSNGKDTIRTWFERAFAAQFDFSPAYSNFLYALLPRWGGDHEGMYQFGEACLATKRFDTSVPMWYVKALAMIVGEDEDQSYWKKPGVDANLAAILKGMAANPPQGMDRYNNLSLCVALAWHKGDYRLARDFIDKLGQTPNSYGFEMLFQTSADSALSEIYANTGPLQSQMHAAEALSKQGKAAQAVSAYEKIVAQNTDAQAELYLRNRLAKLRLDAVRASYK
jgi:hypothetical protein